MSYVNYRGRIAKVLKRGVRDAYKSVFFRGNRFWAAESHGTESLPTVILDALVLRGTEDDSEIIARPGGEPEVPQRLDAAQAGDPGAAARAVNC